MRRLWVLVVGVAALSILLGSTQAKLAQYESKDSNTRYLAKAVKIDRPAVVQGNRMAPALQSSSGLPEPLITSSAPPAELAAAPLEVLAFIIPSRAPPAHIL